MDSRRPEGGERWRLAEAALGMCAIDTLYNDLYLRRARELLATRLSAKDYRLLQDVEQEALHLPSRIEDAIESGRWDQVRALSERKLALERMLAADRELLALAGKLYESPVLHVDPFSRGLQQLSAYARDPERARREGLELLDRLQGEDAPEWREFYGSRWRALGATSARVEAPVAEDTPAAREQRAREALLSGDFSKLVALAGAAQATAQGTVAGARPWAPATELRFEFPPQVVARAAELGLAVEQVPSSREEFAPLRGIVAQPSFTGTGQLIGEPVRLPAPLAGSLPEAMRERVEFLARHAFVNSGGIRLLSGFEAEDLLLEPFDDPAADEEPPRTALLDALGLPRRRGLSRNRIEQALLEHGSEVVTRLGLDPRAFRAVCIPPDLHLRIGRTRGWGRREGWTHFDGYMIMPGGRFLALVGGDVRFGGPFDLVAVGRDYDSDHLVARFCVVQRRRMAAGSGVPAAAPPRP